jgi:thiamine-phosphate pyrophosphorylase
VRAVQLREKDLTPRELYDLTLRARTLDTQVWVNDRIDVAEAADAQGVHLTEASLPLEVARKIAPSSMKLGRSTHHPDTVAALAQTGCDFFLFGPVFPTPSKAAYGAPLGLDALAAAVDAASGIPVLAVGGVTPERVHEIVSTGAHGVAVIRSVLGAPDPAGAVREFANVLGEL